ncbi:DUF3999 family protein [Pedobacter alpinus]|uniref:DUF3999 family protein n=1 Tax=Pedobacter alpinus TaxID=1590643 RepID=A0ABW5TP78_9SPHI
MKLKIRIAFFFAFITCTSFAQLKNYKYQQELKGINDKWHSIVLPDELFSKVSADFSDIRVFGVTKTDTLEAPYLMQIAKDEVQNQIVDFKLINQNSDSKGYYYTFKLDDDVLLNQISLDFKEANFEYAVNLEASNNQNEWFNILNNYRILSIKNSLTNYKFTKLSFTDVQYKYFRLFIPTNKDPELTAAKLILVQTKLGLQKLYQAQSVIIKQAKKEKQTIISVTLPLAVPISKVKILVNNDFDYYRPINISAITDSVKTVKGWVYNYQSLHSATLNSIENNEFQFNSTILKKLEIMIDNGDNQALDISGVELNGFVYQLLVRFNQPATYFLAYGNEKANEPNYDIKNFTDKIPTGLTQLSLGEEKSNILKTEKEEPLFENKLWLWVIMGLIICLLGWFTLKMMRS